MKIELKQYQKIAVKNLTEKVYSYLLKNDNKKRTATLKAPTGSGKTIMMASFIENLIKINNEKPNDIDFTFLWLSIGKGDLHIQSKNSLEKNLKDIVNVQLVDDVFGTTQYELLKNTILVSSWNKIRVKDNKTQEWKSVVMKDGDNVNFREMLDNTNIINRKIILIIDESHSHTDTIRGNEIIDLIKPDTLVEVSATPKININAIETYIEEIDPQDVIKEEMIKNQILVNFDFVLNQESDSDEVVLRSAVNKRNELARYYKENNIEVNPLLLIQLPNAEEGDSTMNIVLNFLKKEEGINRYDDRVAIWLNFVDADERNIENISKNNSPQEYLIFKQAVDTGWDCPRAQILLKFRESNSEVFEIQVLGRILRMPEQKHYKIEFLNKAYVYVNSDKTEFKIDEYGPNILGDQPSKRISDYKNIELQSFYKERADYQDIKKDFREVLFNHFSDELDLKKFDYKNNIDKLKTKGWKFDTEDIFHYVFKDIVLEIDKIDDYYAPIESDQKEVMTISERQIEFISKNLFKNMMSPFTNNRSISPMNVAWLMLCEDLFGPSLVKDSFLSTQSFLILNKPKIEPIFIRAVNKYSLFKEKKAKEDIEHYIENFEIPKEDYFNGYVNEKELFYSKHVLQPCWLNKTRSQPEKDFEKELEESHNVVWWYKNGEMRRDYFGIKYEYDNKDGKDIIHTFYPDYIVQFNDGNIGIFETKSESDQDAHTKTKAKAEELQRYIQKENKNKKKLFGGIVVFKDKEWQINSSKEYSLDNNWVKLEL